MSGGAGIGVTRSRGPIYGDATVEPIMGASHRRSLRAAGGQIPEGPSSAPRRAPPGIQPANDAWLPTGWHQFTENLAEAAR